MHYRVIAVVDRGDVDPLSGGTLEWPPSPLAALCTEEALSLGGNAERGAVWGHVY